MAFKWNFVYGAAMKDWQTLIKYNKGQTFMLLRTKIMFPFASYPSFMVVWRESARVSYVCFGKSVSQCYWLLYTFHLVSYKGASFREGKQWESKERLFVLIFWLLHVKFPFFLAFISLPFCPNNRFFSSAFRPSERENQARLVKWNEKIPQRKNR